jgi:hypothetical protein
MKHFALLLALLCAAAVNAQTTRYVGGPKPFTDVNSNVWSPIPLSIITGSNRWSTCAAAWTNGGLYQQQLVFVGTTGVVTIPVPQGTYAVNLYFAEPCLGELPGQRVFSISVNGTVLDAALDIVKEAGGVRIPLIKSTTITGTSVAVSFAGPAETMVIAGFEILPAGPVVTSVAYSQTVIGTGFVNGSIVKQGGVACPTQFVSSTHLTSQCPAGTGTITVTNPTTAHSVKLNWVPGAVDSTNGAATSFNVFKAPNATGTYAQIAQPVAPPYVDSAVSSGQVPCYKVQGANASGTSLFTAPICASVP